jgi:beta-galactosidase
LGAIAENSWKAVKKYDFIAGTLYGVVFDFGEPIPINGPRSSYYGIIDLAGFPKMFITCIKVNGPINRCCTFSALELGTRKMVDVWAYYNNADEVELFLNGKSLGKRRKTGDSLHVMWRVKFEPGTLAITRKKEKLFYRKK